MVHERQVWNHGVHRRIENEFVCFTCVALYVRSAPALGMSRHIQERGREYHYVVMAEGQAEAQKYSPVCSGMRHQRHLTRQW